MTRPVVTPVGRTPKPIVKVEALTTIHYNKISGITFSETSATAVLFFLIKSISARESSAPFCARDPYK